MEREHSIHPEREHSIHPEREHSIRTIKLAERDSNPIKP